MPPPDIEVDDEPIDLRPYFAILWRYRQVIGASIAIATVLFALVATVVVLSVPTERIAMLQFRLVFPGADSGRFPNGVPFNAMEIVNPHVLAKVFTANALDRYITAEEFQQSIALLQNSPAIERVDAEYLPQLASTRLTPTDRARLQSDYFARRDAIKDPQFDLTLRYSGRLREMPVALMEMALADTIETWARHAETQNGAARPDVDLVSRDMLARAADKGESYVTRLTVMRSGAERILSTLTSLEKVPGARAARTGGNRSLADEVTAIHDLINIDLDPLMGLAHGMARPGEMAMLRAQVSNQLAIHRRAFEAASARVRSLRSALR
jgi:hypothetical protein